MIGVHGQTHFELEQFIDMKSFDDIQVDIWKGIALGKNEAHRGQYYNNIDSNRLSQPYESHGITPVFYAFSAYMALPDDSPVKIAGEELRTTNNNAFLEFLKYAYQAHDSIYIYRFWDTEPGWKNNTAPRALEDMAKLFPSTIAWIDSLVTNNIFSFIGRAYIVAIESGGLSFEHSDKPADPESPVLSEFIHVRPNLNRPFYVWDPVTKEKKYIKTRVGWFNDKDVHGGDIVSSPSYSLRIDGTFTDEFRKRMLNEH